MTHTHPALVAKQPPHHRAHPDLIRAANGSPPPHTLKNVHIAYHFRVHETAAHSLCDVASHCLTFSRWSNETANVLTGAVPCVVALWLAGIIAVIPGVRPEHRWRLGVYAAAVFANGIATTLYHAAASVPALFVRASALDLAGIIAVCFGLLAGRQIPGMGGQGPWCGTDGGVVTSAAWAEVCDPSRGRLEGLVAGAAGLATLVVIVVRSRLSHPGKTPGWLTAITCAPYVPLIADYLSGGGGGAAASPSDSPAGWAALLVQSYAALAVPAAPAIVAALTVCGLALHLTKAPERFLPPGTVDRLGQSHHLWHGAVSAVLAVYGADAVRAAVVAGGG